MKKRILMAVFTTAEQKKDEKKNNGNQKPKDNKEVTELQKQLAAEADKTKKLEKTVAELMEKVKGLTSELESAKTDAQDAEEEAEPEPPKEKRRMFIQAVRKGHYQRLRNPGEKFTFVGTECPSWAVEIDKKGNITGKTSSNDIQVSEAQAFIRQINDLDTLEQYVKGDTREGIVKAYDEAVERIEEANS